jgi:hypothetical protein
MFASIPNSMPVQWFSNALGWRDRAETGGRGVTTLVASRLLFQRSASLAPHSGGATTSRPLDGRRSWPPGTPISGSSILNSEGEVDRKGSMGAVLPLGAAPDSTDPEPAADLVGLVGALTCCKVWMISALLRPLRGIACLAGPADLSRRGPIVFTLAFPASRFSLGWRSVDDALCFDAHGSSGGPVRLLQRLRDRP